MLIRVATVTETDDCRVKVLPGPRPAICVRRGGRSHDQVCPCRSITTAGPSSLTCGVTETTATSTLLAGVSARDTHWSRRQVSGQGTETGAVAVLRLSCSLPETGSSPVSSPSQGVCPTPGCRGVGHIKGARYTGHHRSEPPAQVVLGFLGSLGLLGGSQVVTPPSLPQCLRLSLLRHQHEKGGGAS